jgi:hypothetical protein
MYGPGHGFFGGLWHIAAFLGGLVLTAALVALAVLLVRYLVVATRAAQLYIDAHSAPGSAPAATEPPPATPPAPAAKPAPRPRTPKTPPAAL